MGESALRRFVQQTSYARPAGGDLKTQEISAEKSAELRFFKKAKSSPSHNLATRVVIA